MSADLKFFFQNSRFSDKKVYLKQSYIILSWFYYLRVINSENVLENLKFFVLPVRKQIYTLTKAPIAHKTWSQEQYKFQFYYIRISFHDSFFTAEKPESFNQALLFLIVIKKFPPFLASNLLILKHFRVVLNISDVNFFRY